MIRLKYLSQLAMAGAAALALASGTAAPASAGVTGTAVSSSQIVDFEIFFPIRNPTDLQRLVESQQTPGSASYQKWVTPAQFAAQFGPTADTLAAVKAAVTAAGLQITAQRTRSMHVQGTAAQVQALLQTKLVNTTGADGKSKIVAASNLVMPAALASAGVKIAAFANLPNRQPFATLATATPLADPGSRLGPDGPYWYNDMKEAYDYPSYQTILPNGQRLDGTGVRAAVLMEDLLIPGDLANFFNHEHFTATTGKPVPVVNTVLVDGGGAVGGPGSFEASLDVQQITGGAPGSTVTLFSIPDLSDQHILDGYAAIVDDNTYQIVNSSFGGCELVYTAAYNGGTDFTWILQLYEELFRQGNAQGITFVASSGDQGGPACPSVDYFYGGQNPHFVNGVESPANSPSVTAVGGGNLVTAYTPPRNSHLDSTYVSENGFGDPENPYDIYGLGTNVSGGYWGAGGGVSVVFARPSYQSQVNTGSTQFRTVPDVGMQVGGCPGGGLAITPCGPDRSAAITAYGGSFYGVIGTSVSSPEFVGAAALWMQKIGKRQGNINYYLYHLGQAQTLAGGVNAPASAQFYHRNIDGFDGSYDANTPSKNYNYINGNGTPDVRKLFGFASAAPAGIPQSASNP